ncbi:hypothetical protein QR685DRAFT_277394 [Neurospora intermedia]|uniref:Secreted protein n=1 Tax=Neurospora intermedia TaxID=5142 RepID=A0ABR3DH23_NEUIN
MACMAPKKAVFFFFFSCRHYTASIIPRTIEAERGFRNFPSSRGSYLAEKALTSRLYDSSLPCRNSTEMTGDFPQNRHIPRD